LSTPFYLEEVEELTPDAAVFAGRRLHELEKQDEVGRTVSQSEELGIRGQVDPLHPRFQTIPYEHKQGHSCRDANNQPQAWSRF